MRSKDEILGTLDKDARLEELPFMPEMLRYCGQRFRVHKRAHKTCDPALGVTGRRLRNTVHLEQLRCDGSAHDGCEQGCLMFWKEAWLKRVDVSTPPVTQSPGCTEQTIWSSTKIASTAAGETPTYVCQATQIKYATEDLPWWDLRQYIEDYTSGNVRLSQLGAAMIFQVWRSVADAGLGVGTAMRWIYDVFQKLRGGPPYPGRVGKVRKGTATPTLRLDLQPGELVKVRSYAEILETIGEEDARNRGMYYDPEMVPFSGRVFRVMKRVQKIIDEKSAKMVNFKSDAIILENVVCEARYAKCRRFCPRAIYPYWREIWLERVETPAATVQNQAATAAPCASACAKD